MTLPSQLPPRPTADDEVFEASMRDMKRQLSGLVDRSVDAAPTRPAPAAPTRPPVVPTAPAPGQLWGPSSPRVTSPLQLLIEAASDAVVLQGQIMALCEHVTGEPAPYRERKVAKLPGSLLPAIAALAHEIGSTHAEIGQLVQHLRGRL